MADSAQLTALFCGNFELKSERSQRFARRIV